MALPADYEYERRNPLLDHNGPWTLADVLALPQDRLQRVELVDGAIRVSPVGVYRHQRLAFRIAMVLESACPSGLEATAGVNVLLSDTRLLIPDFTINVSGPFGLTLPASELVMAGEVLSPSTRLDDLMLKRKLYAEAGVPFYLVIDPEGDEVTATLFELPEGEYVEAVRSEAGVLRLDRPFPVTIELSP
ncbi:hypothetical protein FHS29_002378 [Saccharothrix tamanrassetensis]|uniref:Putative restriction endonuclease domain-containing protein n=1 Tax=Saccharothrix tamanrassetensis TaxID=1051531 RepID=A0A841CI44_9PSEU|nr:Uma2 family endonuclease [Saccharothrix tamanrassetensis]MBB5955797.1 hypothetical protein [Saccharothrix tamanrassetensis]